MGKLVRLRTAVSELSQVLLRVIATVPDHSGSRSGYPRRSRTIPTRQTICLVNAGSVPALNQGSDMPNVKGKKYPYTKAGKAAARRAMNKNKKKTAR
tara:strand:+ start:841 stop:1131 length:291 start_codon:yes stop_codon:yes gene_type:complete